MFARSRSFVWRMICSLLSTVCWRIGRIAVACAESRGWMTCCEVVDQPGRPAHAVDAVATSAHERRVGEQAEREPDDQREREEDRATWWSSSSQLSPAVCRRKSASGVYAVAMLTCGRRSVGVEQRVGGAPAAPPAVDAEHRATPRRGAARCGRSCRSSAAVKSSASLRRGMPRRSPREPRGDAIARSPTAKRSGAASRSDALRAARRSASRSDRS